MANYFLQESMPFLDGAKALSIPTRFGQSLEVKTIEDGKSHISWESFTVYNEN